MDSRSKKANGILAGTLVALLETMDWGERERFWRGYPSVAGLDDLQGAVDEPSKVCVGEVPQQLFGER